jgi:hypothetical protein
MISCKKVVELKKQIENYNKKLHGSEYIIDKLRGKLL